MTSWIDISVPVRTGMPHWPGDIDVSVERVVSMSKGEQYNLTQLHMSAHTGTHMDAPLHFVNAGSSIDEMPPGATIGPARVLEITGEVIDRAALQPFAIEAGERILFKTGNSARCWDAPGFIENFVYISQDGARYLVECGVLSVGIDYLSVAGFYHDTVETHVILLEAGIWLIEGLDLRRVVPGRYELVCLPLKLLGADGAPARAVLRPA